MKMNSWNPWHGCNKYSEGCDHCYMYYLDAQRDQDGSLIYKTKTNFNLPLKKTRQGIYKIPSGTMLHVCMTSDFFLEEADVWRDGNMGYDSDSFGCFFLDSDQKSQANPAVSSVQLE